MVEYLTTAEIKLKPINHLWKLSHVCVRYGLKLTLCIEIFHFLSRSLENALYFYSCIFVKAHCPYIWGFILELYYLFHWFMVSALVLIIFDSVLFWKNLFLLFYFTFHSVSSVTQNKKLHICSIANVSLRVCIIWYLNKIKHIYLPSTHTHTR